MIRFKKRGGARRSWRKILKTQHLGRVERAWVASTLRELFSDVARRRPAPLPGVSGGELNRFVSSSWEPAMIYRPSRVAFWAMFVQLSALLGEELFFRLTQVSEKTLCDLRLRRPKPSDAELRSVWMVWSAIFCPENLSNTFHIDTWGAFVGDSGLWVKRFEADRVRGGYWDARFWTRLTRPSGGDAGPIWLMSQDGSRVLRVLPADVLRPETGVRRENQAVVEGVLSEVDSGKTFCEAARAWNTTQAFVSQSVSSRDWLLALFLRTLSVEV